MITLNNLYKYTKHWFGPKGELQMPEYQCNFCGQKATRPHPVEHLPNFEGIKALNATLEATYPREPIKYEAGVTDIQYPYSPRWTGDFVMARSDSEAEDLFGAKGYYRNLVVREAV